jgi:hypothetical protein
MNNIFHLKHKLIQLANLDTDCEIFGSELHQYKIHPCLSSVQIQLFEQKYNTLLPNDYRNFLLEIGNGGAGPGYGLIGIGSESEFIEVIQPKDSNFFAKSFPLKSSWNDLDVMVKSKGSITVSIDEYLDDKFIQGTVPIAHYSSGIFARLVLTGEQRGNIWVDERSNCGGIYPFTIQSCSYFHDNPDDFHFHDIGEPLSFYNWYNDWLNRSLAQVLQS